MRARQPRAAGSGSSPRNPPLSPRTTLSRTGLFLTAALVALTLASCRGRTPAYTARLPAFGAYLDVSMVGVDSREGERIGGLLQQDIAFMEAAWSPDQPGSPLARVNALLHEARAFAAPPSILPLIRESQVYAKRSGNLFNPAIGRLLRLWGFATGSTPSHAPPSARSIDQLVADRPSMADIHLDGIELRCDNPAVMLDFGSFTTGRVIDIAVAHLRDLGIGNAMVRADGNLRVIGDRVGRPWRVPIRRASGGGVLATVAMGGDESLFTAADYDRTFVYAGRTYHDHIDPRTGRPAQGTRSATVITSSAASAAAASTALFIAGPADWYRVAGDMGLTYVLLVDSAGKVHMTPAMQRRVELIDKGLTIELSEPLPTSPGARG